MFEYFILYCWDDTKINLDRNQVINVTKLREAGKTSIVIGDYDYVITVSDIKRIKRFTDENEYPVDFDLRTELPEPDLTDEERQRRLNNLKKIQSDFKKVKKVDDNL